ncbi:MAG: hypothetical protein WCP29_06370 [Acidobacteriota bacterium]
MHQSRSAIAGRRSALALRWAWHYLRRFVIDPALRPFSLGRRAWRLGRAEQVALLLMAAFAALSGVATTRLLPAPLASTSVEVAHFGWMALAWSVALAAASAQSGPLVLVLAGPWFVWYQVLVCSSLVATPWIAIPIAWVGALAWMHVRALPRWRARAAWWLVISAGLGYAAAGPSGLRRALGWRVVDAQTLLASVLFGAGLLGCLARRARTPARGPTFSLSLVGALLAMGTAVTLAALRDWRGTVGWVDAVFSDASGIVVLFWLCVAGQFAAGLLHSTEWIIRRILRFLPLRAAHGGVLAQVVTWSAMAWLVPQALMATAQKVIEARASSTVVASTGLMTIAIGLAFECGKLRRDWRHATDERIRIELGVLALVMACAIALSTTPGNLWETTRLLMILAGMLHLGVPLAMLEHADRFGHESPALGVFARFGSFAAGYFAALMALVIDPRNPAMLLVGVPFLLVGLVLLRRSLPAAGPWNGAVAGALFCGGMVAGWMMPYPPTIPFIPAQALTAVLRDWGSLGRPSLSLQHFGLLAVAWVVGASSGAIVFRSPRPAAPPT